MRKVIIYTLLMLAGSGAFAQKDAQAKSILSQLSAKYRSYKTIRTDFIFELDNSNARQVQNGTLVTSAPGKYMVTLYNPGSKNEAAQQIISNGKTQWTYLKAEKEVQVNNAAKSDDGLNPAMLFTIYEHGYKYIYTGDQKINGKLCQVIELSPEDAAQVFFKIRLMVDKAKKLIYSAILFDKSGSHYTYTLNSFMANVPVSDNTFTFDPKAHPGVEVVDLR